MTILAITTYTNFKKKRTVHLTRFLLLKTGWAWHVTIYFFLSVESSDEEGLEDTMDSEVRDFLII